MQFQFNTFKDYINPKQNQSWQPVAKVGLGFILLGFIAILLKEILIAILSFFLFAIGFIILIIAFRIWKLNDFYSNKIY
jgi:protein-S-isoprenylcysteine O-methyltransferase Ste14